MAIYNKPETSNLVTSNIILYIIQENAHTLRLTHCKTYKIINTGDNRDFCVYKYIILINEFNDASFRQ